MTKLFDEDTLSRLAASAAPTEKKPMSYDELVAARQSWNERPNDNTIPTKDGFLPGRTGWGDWQGHYYDTVINAGKGGQKVSGITDTSKGSKVTQTLDQFLDKYKDAIDPNTGKFIPGKVNLYFDDEDARQVYNNLIGYHSGDGKTGGYFAPEVDVGWVADPRSHGGLGQISDFVSHVGEVVSKNPLAQTVISMAAAAYGVPPNVTMALLAGNNIAQGQDPAAVARGIAMSYLGGKVGDFAGGAAGDALKNSGLSDNVTGALTNLASGAAKQLATTGKVNAQGLLTNAAGNVITGSDTFKDLSADASKYFKDAGLDKIDIGGLSIPGGDGGQVIPGLSRDSLPAKIAEAAVKNTPGYKQVASATKGLPASVTKQIVSTVSGNKGPSGVTVNEETPAGGGDKGLDVNTLLASIGGGGGGQTAAAAPTQNSWAGVELGPDYFDRAASSPTNGSVAELLGLINARA